MVLSIYCQVGTEILNRPVVTISSKYPRNSLSFTDHCANLSSVHPGGRYPHTLLVQPRRRVGGREGVLLTGSCSITLCGSSSSCPAASPGWGLVFLPSWSSLFCLCVGCEVVLQSDVVGIASAIAGVCKPKHFPAGLCCVFFLLCKWPVPKHCSPVLGPLLPHFTDREAEAPREAVSPNSETSTVSALPLDMSSRRWAGLGC